MAAELSVVSPSIADRQTFLEKAYTRYAPTLKGYLMRTVSEHEAEDLVHDVFVRMAKHKGLGVVDNLQAFLFTTATNLLRDRWRRSNAKYAPTWVNCEDVNLEAGAQDPCEVADWQEQLDRVNSEIARLREKPRHAFKLSRMHDRSYSEIADDMEVSVSMIEKHISSALVRLRHAVR